MAKGIVLSPQVSSPLSPTQRGLWVSSTGDIIFSDTTTDRNISQTLDNIESGTGIQTISVTYLNTSGSTIAAGTPVYSPVAGEIAPADGSSAESSRVLGVTTESINNGASGKVAIAGILTGISGYTHGKYLYLGDAPGEVVDVEPTIMDYPSGFYVVILGLVHGTTLILRPQLVGTL